MTKTIGNNLYTSSKVQTSGDRPINRQKTDEKDPSSGRMKRRRNSPRVSAYGSVWGTTDDMAGVASPSASPHTSPRDNERKRRENILRNQNDEVTNLMRFVTNNCSERVTLLQIAMTPSQVCYRSHNQGAFLKSPLT